MLVALEPSPLRPVESQAGPCRSALPALRGVAGYTFAALCSLVILTLAYRLWRTNLEVPLGYGGDFSYYARMTKDVIETGWYFHSDRVGQPGGLDFREFPVSDGWFHWLVVKTIAAVRPDPFFVLNTFFLLTFPLTTLAMLSVCRRLGVAYGPSLVVSLLFTFLPYHFHRMGHPFLAAYYLVPLSILLALRVWEGRLPLFTRRRAGGGWDLCSRAALGTLAAGVLIGLQGVYYACFAVFFLVVAGAARAAQTRSRQPLLAAGLLSGIILTAQLVSLGPAIHYRLTEPRNGDAPLRTPVEAEVFGLKTIQLVLPPLGHRWPPFRNLAARYAAVSPLVNENQSAALGVVGAAGFLLLLGRLLFLPRGGNRQGGALLDGLSLLCVCGLLLGTVGGLGALLAWFAGPWLRAYNRASVFLGCFALLAVALLLQRAHARWAVTPRRRLAFAGLLAALLAFGLLDQTNASMIPNYRATRAEWQSDRDLVARIEQNLQAGDLVFTLPYRYTPECGIMPSLAYELFQPYLHAKKLSFSFGALHGHPGDVWSRWVARMPAQRMVETLARADVVGIWLDRRGYTDAGRAVEAELRRLLGVPLVSRSGHQAYYDLRSLASRLRGRIAAADWERGKQRIRQAILPLYRNDFYAETEFPDAGFGYWSGAAGELHLVNGLEDTRTVRLRMRADLPGRSASAPLRIRGDLWQEDSLLAPGGQTFTRTLVVPPGRHVVRLECDAPPLPSGAPEPQVFRVTGLRCEEE